MKDLFKNNIRSIVLVFLLLSTGGYAVTSSAEISEKKAVVVFVDGSTDELVVTNHVPSSYEIQVFDLTGKEVFKVVQGLESPICRISTSQLRKGIYLVRVTPAPDAPSVTLKVMIR